MYFSKIRKSGVLACIIFLGAGSLGGEPEHTVLSTFVGAGQVTDSKVAQDVWEQAPVYALEHQLGSSASVSVPTRFQVAHDTESLYIRIVCVEPTGTVKAEERERDAAHEIYHDDSVEVFIAPGTQRVDYYQYQANAVGSVSDSWGRQSGTVREDSWTSDFQVVVEQGDDAWTAEFRLPFADMELQDAEGMPWGINIARVRRTEKTELMSYVPLTGSFHQPGLIAPLVLDEVAFSRRRVSLNGPLADGVVVRDDGEFYYQGKIEVSNLNPHVVPVLIEASLVSEPGAESAVEMTGVLNPGNPEDFSFEIPIPALGAQVLTFKMMDRRYPKHPLFRKIMSVDLQFNPIELTILDPVYKDAIFATQNVRNLSGKLSLMLSEKDLEMATVDLVFREEAADGAVIAQTTLEDLDVEMPFSLPIPELNEGAYTLTAVLRRSGDDGSVELSKRIRKLAPAPSGIEWRVDKNGVLLRNGEPFLPIGWFSLRTPKIAEYADTYNITWHYWGPWQDVEDLRGRMDAIAEAGGYIIFYPTVRGERPEHLTQNFITKSDEQAIRERIRALKDHPALLAWALADEPEYSRVLPEALKQLHEIVEDEDPYHPTMVINNSFQAIRRYAEGGDILAPDPYPFFKIGGGSAGIGRVGQFIAEAASAAKPGQGVWVIPQAHDTRDFGGTGERAPNFVESRNMAWQAIITGAKGMVWFSWTKVDPNVIDSVLGNAYIASEVELLRDFVFAADAGGVRVSSEHESDIRVARRITGKRESVVVINTAFAPRSFGLDVPAWKEREVFVAGEGRRVQFDAAGNIKEALPAYGTRIYTTDPAVGDLPLITDVQAEIDQRLADVKRPGNLAHESYGTTIQASSRGRYKGGPIWMLDGHRDGQAWQGSEFSGEDRVDISWPEPVSIGRLAIFSEAVATVQLEVQRAGDSAYTRVDTQVQSRDGGFELRFSPVKIDRLRLIITGLQANAAASRISEIEAYAK